jgi:enterochelin esterase-like enzyme
MKLFVCSFFLLLYGLISTAQTPKAMQGSIRRVDSFRSKFVTPRNIDIWLPEGYTPEKKYAVLYMHDGQMLFDAAITWNKQAWDVDDLMGKLIKQERIKNVIVVGIWNGGTTRHADYFPQKPYEGLTQTEKDTVTAQLQRAGRTKEIFKAVSDGYLKFLVTELKPYIDKNYSTHRDRKNTFIAGSSMGGLISLYAICEYPDVFGGAACLSTHWPGLPTMENNPVPAAFLKYLSANLPDAKNHKLYFDCGDQTLDALYPPLQKKADLLIKAKGYTEQENWITKYFRGANHSEDAWKKRFNLPVLFLLGTGL